MDKHHRHRRTLSRDVPLTLRDIQGVTPVESKDETIVMSSFEKMNPTGSLRHDEIYHPHFGIPPQVLESPREDDDNPHPIEFSTVEDDLIAYTKQLHEIHNDHPEGTGQVQSLSPVETGGNEEFGKGQADKLASNLGKLFQRHQSTRAVGRAPTKTSAIGDIEQGGKKALRRMKQETTDTWHEFNQFLSPRKQRLFVYVKNIVVVIVVPSILLAALFYYVLGNPTVDVLSGSSGNKVFSQFLVEERRNNTRIGDASSVLTGEDLHQYASISWWILFIGVRQFATLGLARIAQLVLIDYLCLHLHLVSRLLGPFVTLLLVQSRGWPCVLTSWATIDFLMLYGSGKFANHWLFYQSWVGMATDRNPSGNVLDSYQYRSILTCAIVLGVATTLKRFWVGLSFGKRSFSRYSDKLSSVLRRSLLVSKLARFANEKDNSAISRHCRKDDKAKLVSSLNAWLGTDNDADKNMESGEINSSNNSLNKSSTHSAEETKADDDKSLGVQRGRLLFNDQNKLTESEQLKITELLGEWEDTLDDDKPGDDPSLSSIVMFRTSVSFLDSENPFSPPFGVVRTRLENVEGSQRLYNRLVDKQKHHSIDDEELQFVSIVLTAFDGHHRLDEAKAKELIALFRPGRDGGMPLLEFCKSIDQLYKEIRMLRASIANEGKMNKASEHIINVFFFIFIGMILLAILGIDPIALLGVTTAFVVGSAFMIGGASSKYFEGLLFILVQRPYDIGDMISIYNKEGNLSIHGYQPWRVKDVGLYHTTIIHFNGECASISNGALAQSRIMNGARSPTGRLVFFMKFGVKHASNQRVEQYRERVTAFMKERPREWLGFVAFRITRIEPHLGFVEYIHIVQHRERWQEIGGMLDSLSDVQRYAHEVSQELAMDYESPSLPIQFSSAQMQSDHQQVRANVLGKNPTQSMMQNVNHV